MLRQELVTDMILCGLANVEEIGPELVVPAR
jgi:isopentenyl diphosphate isomerase/L-lactate dehydrogenase-like FMN-dependent dehydrogenase